MILHLHKQFSFETFKQNNKTKLYSLTQDVHWLSNNNLVCLDSQFSIQKLTRQNSNSNAHFNSNSKPTINLHNRSNKTQQQSSLLKTTIFKQIKQNKKQSNNLLCFNLLNSQSLNKQQGLFLSHTLTQLSIT